MKPEEFYTQTALWLWLTLTHTEEWRQYQLEIPAGCENVWHDAAAAIAEQRRKVIKALQEKHTDLLSEFPYLYTHLKTDDKERIAGFEQAFKGLGKETLESNRIPFYEGKGVRFTTQKGSFTLTPFFVYQAEEKRAGLYALDQIHAEPEQSRMFFRGDACRFAEPLSREALTVIAAVVEAESESRRTAPEDQGFSDRIAQDCFAENIRSAKKMIEDSVSQIVSRLQKAKATAAKAAGETPSEQLQTWYDIWNHFETIGGDYFAIAHYYCDYSPLLKPLLPHTEDCLALGMPDSGEIEVLFDQWIGFLHSLDRSSYTGPDAEQIRMMEEEAKHLNYVCMIMERFIGHTGNYVKCIDRISSILEQEYQYIDARNVGFKEKPSLEELEEALAQLKELGNFRRARQTAMEIKKLIRKKKLRGVWPF